MLQPTNWGNMSWTYLVDLMIIIIIFCLKALSGDPFRVFQSIMSFCYHKDDSDLIHSQYGLVGYRNNK